MKRTHLILLTACLFLAAACNKQPVGPQEEEAEVTVEGTVKGDDGELLKGVVVSDGRICAKTDENGHYQLRSALDNDVRFIMVSTPSGYSAPVDKGLPIFFKRRAELGEPDSEGKYHDVDFTLEKIPGNPERFTVIVSADLQPRNSSAGFDNFAYHALDCCEDVYRSWRELTEGITDRKVYGITLGDIVHENMTLYKNYKAGLATQNFPTYNVMGNHDHDLDTEGSTGGSYIIGPLSFERELCPVTYSFNLGKIHVIVMDDIFIPNGYCKKGDYLTGITDRDWDWLQNDLKTVDRGSTIFYCTHSPMFMQRSLSDRGKKVRDNHISAAAYLLAKYAKVHAWAGHTHTVFNYNYPESDAFKNVEVHTLPRTCGELWTNEFHANGAPRGYTVVDVDGDNVSWVFHPVKYQSSVYVGTAKGYTYTYPYRNYDFGSDGVARMRDGSAELGPGYQCVVYAPGTYKDKYVYANVYYWDDKWSLPVFTPDGGAPTTMTQVNKNNGELYMYDFNDKDVATFYREHCQSLADNDYNWSNGDLNTLFNAYCKDIKGSGTVSVTDRFGNKYETRISWNNEDK